MYQGIYVAPLQVKANKNVNKNLDIFACRWSGGLVIVNAESEDKAMITACGHTNIEPSRFQISKLPNSSAIGESRVLYMEVHEEKEVSNE